MAIGLFTALLLLQFAIVAAPRAVVVRFRGVHWLGQPINWFEANLPQFSVIHFVLFTLLGLLAHFALPRAGFAKLLALLLGFALLGELLQWAIPGRDPGLADLAADVGGILFGLGVVFAGLRLRRRFES